MALVRKFDGAHPLPPRFKGSRELDRTRLSMLPRDQAATAANLALFQLQDLTPEEIVMGSSVMFTVVCAKCGLDPSDMVEMAKKVLNAPDEGDTPTGNALLVLKDFIAGRVMAHDVTIG